MSKKPETVFKERVYREISELGAHIYIEKIQQVAKRGSADFHLCVAGAFVAIELKMDGEKPDELQLFKLRKVEKAGGLAFVATPENWPFILETLKGLTGENLDKLKITVQDLYDMNLIGAFQQLMRLSLPYQTSRNLVKLAETFDKEKKLANDYLARTFDGKTFAQLKEMEEAEVQSEDSFEMLIAFKEFYKQEIYITPVPMSELKNANIVPVVLKILTGKILVED